MPPKKQAQAKTQKSVDDKTFGMKNKKGAKAQKYVQQVQQAAQNSGRNKKDKAKDELRQAQLSKKELDAKKKAELADIFKPIHIVQKVPFGVDPKTVLCIYFKQGTCQKGARCKFSHDPNVERKSAKADLYTDKRDQDNLENGSNTPKKEDNMEDWDQAELEKAVQRHIAKDNINKPTEIVCKYFLDAIESRKYGWFWDCPNGDKCIYRHALPPGFVLKKKETAEERAEREAYEKEHALTIEDFLETERHKLGKELTPVTEETFKKWKEERKLKEKDEKIAEAQRKKDAYDNFKAGMKSGIAFSGRELFDFNPDWANQQGEDDVMDDYTREDDETDNVKVDRVYNDDSRVPVISSKN